MSEDSPWSDLLLPRDILLKMIVVLGGVFGTMFFIKGQDYFMYYWHERLLYIGSEFLLCTACLAYPWVYRRAYGLFIENRDVKIII